MRRFALLGTLLAVFSVLVAAPRTVADHAGTIHNGEQRVSGHGLRFGAEQTQPDIGGDWVVWLDQRGDSDTSSVGADGQALTNRLWAKNLSTRAEAPVTVLATQFSPAPKPNPRVSPAGWVVWSDLSTDQDDHDIYACQLPCTGTPITVSGHSANQKNPSIDGTSVVWEDDRNVGTGGGIDIFTFDFNSGKGEEAVVTEPGDQTSPSISGSTVVWRDNRDGAEEADVYVKSGKKPGSKVADAGGTAAPFSAFTVAVSGKTLLWNETDPTCGAGDSACEAPKVLKSCELPCKSVTERDRVSSGPEDFSTITDLDVSGSRATWARGVGFESSQVFTVDLATTEFARRVDTSTDATPATGARVDGSRLAWLQQSDDFQGTDVFWDDITTAEAPRRANSIGLGTFGEHASPAAESDHDLVVYRVPNIPGRTGRGGIEPHVQVWATDLSNDSHRPLSRLLATDASRPAIGDNGSHPRVVWSECITFGLGEGCTTNAVEKVIDESDGEPVNLFNNASPDADGLRTVWRCDDAALCVHDGTGSSVEIIDLPQRYAGVVTNLVRISGDLVAWHEFLFDNASPEAALHVLNLDTGDDEVIAKGVGTVGEFGDFEISGVTVVWAGQSDIWTADAAGCGGGGTTCDTSGSEVALASAGVDQFLHSPSVDGIRAAWVDDSQAGSDIYTQDLTTTDVYLVTDEVDSQVGSPYVDGDRIFWIDGRDGGSDIYMENADDDTDVLFQDITVPGQPGSFTATIAAHGIALSWEIPADAFQVRILRKVGSAPTGIDDTSASVVYEGADTSFVDTDVVAGVSYTYAAFAYDHEPNFSILPATASP